MKYIRTKDGIYKSKRNPIEKDCLVIGEKENGELGLIVKDIVAKADTIEELCDEFVYEILTGEIEEPMYRDIHNAGIDIKTQLKIYEDNMTSVCAIYGAIWVQLENGAWNLCSVAKVNKKGKLELL